MGPDRSATGPESAIYRIAVARLISWMGTEAAYIALIALVYERSGGSGVWISAALLAALGARVVVSPWAGLLGDYFDRRTVMITSDLGAAACFTAIATTHSLPVLVLIAALAGVAEAPFSPASSALLAMLVPEGRRGWASGTVAAGSSTGMLIGAACGGVLVASVGAAPAFLINALSFVVSAALVGSIRGRFRMKVERDSKHRGAAKGVLLVLSQKTLRVSTFSVALVALALGMTNVAELPLFISIGAGKIGFGVAVAAWAGGQVAGGRLAAKVVGPRMERRVLIGSCAVLAATIGLAGAVPVFALIALLFTAAGIGNALANISLILMVQRWSPPQVQSRAIAAIEATANTAVGVSLVAGGLLLSPLGARGVYLLAGMLGAVATAIAFRIPRDGVPIRTAPDAVHAEQHVDSEESLKAQPWCIQPRPARASYRLT